ncbi:MAG: glycosyltransferase, partial [Candidatus Thiodiazotropha sp. (ex Lucinoma borealis)]|nr:glycosyltransferase [Candidatus Thiodiazotropha sp. (ex Lucinoma borealis)]
KGGRLLASVPNGAHAALRLELLEGRFTYEDTGLLDRTHLHLFTYHSLRELFSRCGFRVNELSYTFHDMADSEISNRLERLGMQVSDLGLARFHTPDAAAFQFIVSATPDVNVSADDFPTLTDKPMESSIEVYRNLFEELHQTGTTAATRLEMVEERDRLLEEQHQHLLAFHAQRDEWTAQGEALNKALQESQSALADESRLRSELENQVRMLESNVLSINHDRILLKTALHYKKRRLHDVLNSRGWRGYMALMLPLRFWRKFSPNLKELLGNPGLLLDWSRKAKRLWKRGGVTAIREHVTTEITPTYNYSRWIRDVEPVGLPSSEVVEALNVRKDRPLISIVMPVFNVEESWLRVAINSVLDQSYLEWELCIADDASTLPHVKRILIEYERRYKQIKVIYREVNGHISAATNSALSLATGDYVGLMDHDDKLAPYALFFVAQEIVL